MTGTTMAMPDAKNAAPQRGYQYKYGDRPLDGYTIQRGAGRGGFGEVYYALSDSGREVALKLVHTYEQIELRGISQCMNLKSPHLVTIFDVRHSEDGRPWVIMEYVSGPSLRQLLDASPSGLGTQKAAFFLREIGKGLTYLHDCGIVHRDLKPGNIFYENGYVKIGDYGLSKAISTSQHSGQTVTVGTVHYMAPEIGAGKYDKSIDIYALGALLFEMLTGQVPFFGASPAEVLMKHLSIDVDTSALEEPFRTVIKRAMAKNPADRYQSVQEMVEAVFGSEHVRNSVSHFSPDSLTIVAGQVAQKIAPSGGASGSFTPSDAPDPKPFCRGDWLGGDWLGRVDWFGRRNRLARTAARHEKMAQMRQRLATVGNRIAALSEQAPPGTPSHAPDPLGTWQRVLLSGIATGISALVITMLMTTHGDKPAVGMIAMFAIAAGTTGAAAGWWLLAGMLSREPKWLMRIAVGGSAGIVACLSTFLFTAPLWTNPEASPLRPARTMLAIFIGYLMMDWPERLSPVRKERVRVGNLITAAILGLVLGHMFDGHAPLVVGVLAGTSLAASIWAPWRPWAGSAQGAVFGSPARPFAGAPIAPAPARPASSPIPPPPVPPPIGAEPLPPAPLIQRPVPRWARIGWLVLFIAFATVGLTLWLSLASGVFRQDEDAAMAFAFGTGALIAAGFSLRRSFKSYFSGYWGYLFRPFIQFACIQSILGAGSMAMIGNLRPDDMPIAIFWTVFPALVLGVVTFLAKPGGRILQVAGPHPPTAQIPPPGESISFTGVVLGIGRFGVTVVGSVLLVFGLVLALAVVMDVPGLFASGALNPKMPRELDKAFGMHQWPQLMRHVGVVLSVVSSLAATTLLLLARRRWGVGHMLSLLAGVMLLFSAVLILGRGAPDWYTVSVGPTPAATLEQYFQSIQMRYLWWAAGFFLVALFMLLWPPNRSPRVRPEYFLQQNFANGFSQTMWQKPPEAPQPQAAEAKKDSDA